MKKSLVWFRNDLRVQDNLVLSRASRNSDEIYPVYIVDERHFENTELGISRTSSFRAQFLLESLEDLKTNLQKRGGDLILRIGKPEELIPQLAKQLGVSKVYASKESAVEEVQVEDSLEKQLWSNGIVLELEWQSTLYHVDDIPWPIKHLPETFTDFRKEAEMVCSVKEIAETPEKINTVIGIETGEIPKLENLNVYKTGSQSSKGVTFEGGESKAWQRLDTYFWKQDRLKEYKQTRNQLLGMDYSSKFSPWLALGCISPKSIYYQVKRYEHERLGNASTYWLIFELLWRDYFKFVAKKHGANLYKLGGLKNKPLQMTEDKEEFKKWAKGQTGVNFIDANMKELNSTGFMSNRGRQNVASYLINDLNINWTWGASYFESLLIDYDPCSNWGNWCYLAGVGNDPRPNRRFNIESQKEKYDPKGEYVEYWL